MNIAGLTLLSSSREQGVKHGEESTTTSPYCVMVLDSVKQVLNEEEGKFYVFDHGKQKLLSYDLDSLVANPSTYKFYIKAKFDKFATM